MLSPTRITGLAATAALMGSTLAVAAPAQAAPGDATMSFSPTAVLEEGSCIDHPFSYNVELPEGTESWTLHITMVGPDNEVHSRETHSNSLGDAPSGNGALTLCSAFEETGTYTVLSTVEHVVGGRTTYGTEQNEGTFQAVRSATTKTRLVAKRKGAKIVVKAKVSISTVGDYGPVEAGGKVIFKKKFGSRWRKVDTGLTNSSGVASGTFESTDHSFVRAIFKGMGEAVDGQGTPVPPSASEIVRVR